MRVVIFAAILAMAACGQGGNNPVSLSSARLDTHLQMYVGSGPHRSGGPGDMATRGWFSTVLSNAGFDVEIQAVPIRQWRHDKASLKTSGGDLNGFPLWPPAADADGRRASGRLRSVDSVSAGDMALIPVPTQLAAALTEGTKAQLTDAIEKGAVGVILMTETISGEPFAFNMALDEHSYKGTPILVLGSAHKSSLKDLLTSDEIIQLQINGAYEDRFTWNVIGRMDRRGDDVVVVSTPRTGWFRSGAERGPGVALFLEFAKWIAENGDADLVFVGTGGHEIGHVGMQAFLAEKAPSPQRTSLWVHLGASIAAYNWQTPEQRTVGAEVPQNAETRWIIYSGNLSFQAWRQFSGLAYQHSPGYLSAFGEAKDIRAAGYPRFFAFAGWHPYFHLPSDDALNTSGDLLIPTGEALAALIEPHL